MSAPLFDTIAIVDWSARSAPSPERPTKDAIFVAVARGGEVGKPAYCRTRAEALDLLETLAREEAEAGRRLLMGFDFPFGYPAGVARHLTGRDDGLALWQWLAERIEDGPDNANNRYAVAEEMNRAWPGTGPMWGRPADWAHPDLPTRASARQGAHPPERRIADGRARGAKTVWQLAYAGSVGSQVLLGLPALQRLRARTGAVVWPFETGLAAPKGAVVLAEVYPSLLQAEAHAGKGDGPLDAAQVSVTARALSRLDAGGRLAPLFAPDLDPEEAAVVAREEAWILGLGHEAALRAEGGSVASAPRPPRPMRPYLRDPAAIYAASFETVRREARLDRFPPALQPLVIRLIHSCGMVEVADRIAHSGTVAEAGARALAAGAPVLCDCEMVAAGIIRSRLPAGNEVVVTLNDGRVPDLAARLGTTRSAAAVELWRDRIEGAVVAIGNAPTALFHLLEKLDQGWPRPAAILGFPVGFVGAAESKAELAADPRGCAFVTLKGRRGGSAMASAAVNALAAGLPGEAG